MDEFKQFNGILDTDNAEEIVAPGSHVMAKNGVFRGLPGNMRFENIPGNEIKLNPNALTGACVLRNVAPCVAVAITGIPEFPDGMTGEAYNYVVNITGTAPFNLTEITKPAWMTIAIVGSTVVLSGVPNATGSPTVAFTVNNCSGSSASLSQVIEITASGSCIVISIASGTPIPDAIVGESYFHNIYLNGTAPFSLGSIVKPAWMTISIIGATILLTGSPSSVGTDIPVSFIISHDCGADTVNFSETIDVKPANNSFIYNGVSSGFQVISVTGVLVNGSNIFGWPCLPVGNGSSCAAVHAAFTGVISVSFSTTGDGEMNVRIMKNGTPLQTIGIDSPSDSPVSFSSQSFLATDILRVYLEEA